MKKNTALKTSLQVALILLAMLYGVLIGTFQFPPYALLKATRTMLQSKEHTEVSQEYNETDIAILISIHQVQDISARRSELISYLWGEEVLPSSLPTVIEKQFTDKRYADIASLHHIEKLVISMEFGLDSLVYHFMPKKPNNKVVLYHQGHHGDFFKSKEQIKQLLDNGYSVIAFAMPLLGLNNQPSIWLPRNGQLKLSTHEQMQYLLPERGHPIKYFIEPVVVTLNYLKTSYDYSSISMVGISGGGWTTTIVAAIDTRIEKSFPVAGSYPIYLRSNSPRDWGDYEQVEPGLYSTVNYLELYVLAAFGANRKQLQIINKYDPCCFAGTKWKTYKDTVSSRVQKIGAGEFDLFLDESHMEHQISDVGMTRIIGELDATK